jgi:hypothetical protein
MKKLGVKAATVCMVALLAGSAFGFDLDIQLSPPTLVLSSGGDQLTIHTNFPHSAVDDVTLVIAGNDVTVENTWADDCGDLVVRCSKEAVREAVGPFEDKFTEVDVTLTVTATPESGLDDPLPGSATLRVRK